MEDKTKDLEVIKIAEDANLSVDEKIAQILEVHKTVTDDEDEFYRLGCIVYEKIRYLLLCDNYEDCRLDDIVICNCLLAESYWRTQKSYLIAPLAKHTYEKLYTFEPKDPEICDNMISSLGRIVYVLTGTGHPRLMMRLSALQFEMESRRENPDTDTLEDAADTLINLAALTGCDTWYAPHRDAIVALLGAEKVEGLEKNPSCGHLNVDPIEFTEEWENIIDEVEAEVAEEMKDEPFRMGYCFGYWHAKEAALSRRGIDWRSPQRMNPGVMFD